MSTQLLLAREQTIIQAFNHRPIGLTYRAHIFSPSSPQVVQVADADFRFYPADADTLLVLERVAFVRVARQLRQVLHESQHHLDGKLHRPRMGHEAVRQVRGDPFTTCCKIRVVNRKISELWFHGSYHLSELRVVTQRRLLLIARLIRPTDNLVVAMASLGEGWHNYHHVFPWDYRTGEIGGYRINITTAFIHFFAYLGLAYDLKTANPDMIKQRATRSGDGTYQQT